jgi:hypothetical protein
MLNCCVFSTVPVELKRQLAEHEAATFDASLLLEVHVNVDSVLDFNIFKCSSTTFPFIAYKLRKLSCFSFPPMATSPSDSSASFVSHSSSREPTPEWDPIPAYEKHAPLHWDADGWDFEVASESDGDLTDGDDLQLLVDGELDSDTSTDWRTTENRQMWSPSTTMTTRCLDIGWASSPRTMKMTRTTAATVTTAAVTRTAMVVATMTAMMMAGQSNAMRCLPASVVGCCMVAYSGRKSSSLY